MEDTDDLYRNLVMPVQAVEASGSATVVDKIVLILATVGTLRLRSTPSFGYLMACCPSALMSSGGTDLIYYLFWAILRDPQIPLR
jgi:hypothetical protein